MEQNNFSSDLAYFIALQQSDKGSSQEDHAQKWDHRAVMWQRERVGSRKGDARVVSAVAFLEERGLLQDHYDIADIGCGPGRFAAAFAKRVHQVVGLDISEKMVEYGREYLQQEGLTNVVLQTCDFETLDIKKEGYRKAFDLVFSSMTPAIHNMDSLLKSMEMSRGWCCHITHIGGRNLLRDQLMKELFGRKMQPQWTGKWFYSLFNILFLLGYDLETSYEKRHQEIWVVPDEEYVEFVMEHMLPSKEHTKENAGKILHWLLAHQNQEGKVLEISDSSYGRILWDVRNKAERPGYGTENGGF